MRVPPARLPDPPYALGRWALLVTGLLALVIVPFLLFGDRFDAWSIGWLQPLEARPATAAALVVALLAADPVLPIPSSVIGTLSGGLLGFAMGTIASFAGLTAGCVLAYAIGAAAGRPAATRLVGERALRRAELVADRHGAWAIVATRAVPVLAEASTVLAGTASMSFGRFIAVTSAANLGVALAYAAVGAYAARIDSFFLAFAGAVMVPLAAAIAHRLVSSNEGTPS